MPIYIGFLGIEGYALVAIFVAFQSILLNLEFGLGSSLVQGLAKLSDNSVDRIYAVGLVRSFEFLFLVIVIVISLFVFYFGSSIASDWIRSSYGVENSKERVIFVLALVALGLQWPSSIYSWGLTGMHRQDCAAITLAAVTSLRAIAAMFALAFIGTIESFLLTQIAGAAALTLIFRFQLFNKLKTSVRVPYALHFFYIKKTAKFTVWMFGISIISVTIPHLDKLILSGILDLRMLGFYSIASTLATGISFFTVPLFNLSFPRFTKLFHAGRRVDLVKSYFGFFKITFIVLFPITLFFVLFGKLILFVVSGEYDFPKDTETVLVLLALSNMLLGLMHIPYAAQLASGRTKGVFFTNLFGLFVLVISITFLGKYFGMIGGGVAWLFYNLTFSFGIMAVLVVSDIRNCEGYLRALKDAFVPTAAVTLVGLLLVYIIPSHLSRSYSFLTLIFVLIIFYVVVFLFSKNLHLTVANALQDDEKKFNE